MVAWQDRLLVEAFGPKAQGDDGVQRWVTSIGIAVAVGVAFFLAAQLGLALLATEERVAVFWPASGIAAGSLIALGPRARVPVAAGVIAASIAANMLGDRSFLSALTFGLCNAAEALLVMWLIERWFGPAFNLDSLRRVVGFFAAAAIATATAAAGASVAMKVFGPSTAALLDVWKVWFPSGALGVVTVAPLLIGVAGALRNAPSWRELLEGTLAVVGGSDCSDRPSISRTFGPLVADRAVCYLFPTTALARVPLSAGICRCSRVHYCRRHRVDDNP